MRNTHKLGTEKIWAEGHSCSIELVIVHNYIVSKIHNIATDLDGSHSKHDVSFSLNIRVHNTKDMLEVRRNHQRHLLWNYCMIHMKFQMYLKDYYHQKRIEQRRWCDYSFSSERSLALGFVTLMASCWARSTKVFLK